MAAKGMRKLSTFSPQFIVFFLLLLVLLLMLLSPPLLLFVFFFLLLLYLPCIYNCMLLCVRHCGKMQVFIWISSSSGNVCLLTQKCCNPLSSTLFYPHTSLIWFYITAVLTDHGGPVSSTSREQIKSIKPYYPSTDRVEMTLSCLWDSWICFILIQDRPFINLLSDQWGVKKEELTSLNVLQCLSCIITHLWK